MPLESLLDDGVLVGGVVIHDQMQLQRFRRFTVDLFQKGQLLLMSVLCFDAADQSALQLVQGSEQREGAVTNIVKCSLHGFGGQ